MIESRRKLLTEALGECWHEFYIVSGGVWCKKCGAGKEGQRTFATADDYEALREKVIEPNLMDFDVFLQKCRKSLTFTMWWLTLSPEQCNEIICDFGIAVLEWVAKK